MSKGKPIAFEIGDIVYHKADEEPRRGIVTALVNRGPVSEVEVDWGPEAGTSIHVEITLTDTFVPKFGDR